MTTEIYTEISIEKPERLREDYGIEPGDDFSLAMRLESITCPDSQNLNFITATTAK
jgi:hypothetical protein